MSTILVEARRDPAPGEALDRLAAACHRLGHDVFRWRGPRSGRVPHWRWLFPCDLAILWNGSHPGYRRAVQTLRQRCAKLLFAELGWHPQRGTIQIDPQGVNARAGWAGEPLTAYSNPHAPREVHVSRSGTTTLADLTPLPVRAEGDLLVVLQLDRDTQITELSPWFPDMWTFVEFICRYSALPLRVRAHPRELPDAQFRRHVIELGGIWDNSPSLAAALETAKALACINSSCGVEALAAGWPVLCYGQAIYRHPGAVVCLDNDPAATQQATTELAAGRCGLFREPIGELTARILQRQWPVWQIDERLPALLQGTLAGSRPHPRGRRSWLDPLIRWTRDLPPRVLGNPATG